MEGPNEGMGRAAETLAVQVADALRSAILAGQYKTGDKLPSEAQLTEVHGVSRTVVREAIAALRSDGFVESRRGAGIFVLEPVGAPGPPFQNIDHARISSIIELLELRGAVEVEAAALASARRSPVQEEIILERHCTVGECIANGKTTSGADFMLHKAIAEAANNPRFVEFMTLIGPNAIPRAALAGANGKASQAYLTQIHQEHGCIVSAISSGDPKAAREAMRAHLQGSQRRYRALLQTHRYHTSG